MVVLRGMISMEGLPIFQAVAEAEVAALVLELPIQLIRVVGEV